MRGMRRGKQLRIPDWIGEKFTPYVELRGVGQTRRFVNATRHKRSAMGRERRDQGGRSDCSNVGTQSQLSFLALTPAPNLSLCSQEQDMKRATGDIGDAFGNWKMLGRNDAVAPGINTNAATGQIFGERVRVASELEKKILVKEMSFGFADALNQA